MSPPSKKAKREATSAAPAISHDNPQNSTPCYLLRLPLETLAEILCYTRPPDLLSVARTSKYFCRVLCDPRSSFVWKRARIDPDFLFVLPDPLPNIPEPAYAAMIFDPGKCCICKKRTDRMLPSYACRSRVCSATECMRHWNDKFATAESQIMFLKTVFEESHESLLHILALCGSVHLDPLESPSCEPSSFSARYLTKEWKAAMRTFARKYFKVRGDHQAFDVLISSYAAQKEIQTQRYQHYLRLHAWSKKYEELKRRISFEHLQEFQSFARKHYLQMVDVEKGATFLRVKRLCLSRIDEPVLKVIEPYVERIIEETGVIAETRERRACVKRLAARRKDIENYYKNYHAPILPSLRVFRSLPILYALQRKDAAKSIQGDLQSDAITTSVHDQLEQWVKRAKDDIMKLLGYGRGTGLKEYRAHTAKVHPLERATALFQCKECKRVGSSYARMGVLDFRGLCLHECLQPERSNADKTKWLGSNFELASKAITTARVALEALGGEEDTTRFTDLGGEWFRCKMCPHGVRDMEFEDLLRHCQRHPAQSITHSGRNEHRTQHTEPAKRLRSFAELAFRKHGREVVRHQFACAHCRFRNSQDRADAEPTWVEVEDPKRIDFNALRSHLWARHKVRDVRNEDYYWLPWDASMEPSKEEPKGKRPKEKKKASKPVAPPRSTPMPTPKQPEPMEKVAPDAAYQHRRRRIHGTRHYCKHCPEAAICPSSSPSSSSMRGFDWQGLMAHMKSKHSVNKPAEVIDYEMCDQDQSGPSTLARS